MIEETLSSGGKVKILASGNSMDPVIKNGIDTVVIKKAENTVKKNDIVLFRRGNGKLVLHRVTAVDGDTLTLRGDSQWTQECVDKSDVIGILEAVEKDGRVIKSDDGYFKKYKIILPAIRWKRRIINSIKLRLGAKTNDKHS